MADAMHETYQAHAPGEDAAPSDRAFGLTVGGIFAAIGVARLLLGEPSMWSTAVLVGGGVLLIVPALLAPRILAPLNRLWMKLGALMASIVNPIVMLAMFVTIFVPAALVMRLMGRDPLTRRIDRRAASYWIDRQPPGPASDSLTNQF